MGRRAVGIVGYERKENILSVARQVVRTLDALDVDAVMEAQLAQALGRPADGDGRFERCEFICVLGGDGTILSALDIALPLNIPLLGVDMGRVGYLSEVQPEHAGRDITRALNGEGKLDRRMLLRASTSDGQSGLALNDVSFNRSEASVGILALEMSAGGVMVDRVAGDGLVVATATGSTAYSLSAGGPVVAPGLECILLTPICSHTLHARPVVVSADEVVRVRVLDDRSRVHVLLDGRRQLTLPQEDPVVTLTRAKETVSFIRLEERNFFDLMHKKLSDWTH